MRYFMAENREKQTKRRNDIKKRCGRNGDGKQLDLTDPHSAARQICGDQPNTQKKDDEPTIINAHGNTIDACNRNSAFVETQGTHSQVSKAVASVSISGCGSVRDTRRSNSGSSYSWDRPRTMAKRGSSATLTANPSSFVNYWGSPSN